jgi:hypothetical protein
MPSLFHPRYTNTTYELADTRNSVTFFNVLQIMRDTTELRFSNSFFHFFISPSGCSNRPKKDNIKRKSPIWNILLKSLQFTCWISKKKVLTCIHDYFSHDVVQCIPTLFFFLVRVDTWITTWITTWISTWITTWITTWIYNRGTFEVLILSSTLTSEQTLVVY